MHRQAEVVLGRLLPPPRGHDRPRRQQVPPARDPGGSGAAPSPDVSLANGAADPSPTRHVDGLALPAVGEVQARVRAVVSQYAYGELLPTSSELARKLQESEDRVRVALRALEAAGETSLHGRARRFRLRPGQLHPMDADFDRAVREGLAKRMYVPGAALPTGLLGRRHGVASRHLARACRQLIADGLIAHRNGPAGPGYYVLAPTDPTDHSISPQQRRRP